MLMSGLLNKKKEREIVHEWKMQLQSYRLHNRSNELIPSELIWIILLKLSKCNFVLTPEHLTEKTQQRRKKHFLKITLHASNVVWQIILNGSQKLLYLKKPKHIGVGVYTVCVCGREGGSKRKWEGKLERTQKKGRVSRGEARWILSLSDQIWPFSWISAGLEDTF